MHCSAAPCLLLLCITGCGAMKQTSDVRSCLQDKAGLLKMESRVLPEHHYSEYMLDFALPVTQLVGLSPGCIPP